jgi:hypothetical protein
MFAPLSNLLHTFALLREELESYWQELEWKSSDEYKETVKLRLAAHEQAVKEGYSSPYVDPENYNSAWQPIVKIPKSSE